MSKSQEYKPDPQCQKLFKGSSINISYPPSTESALLHFPSASQSAKHEIAEVGLFTQQPSLIRAEQVKLGCLACSALTVNLLLFALALCRLALLKEIM